jgi:hypothetical protein
MLQERASRRQVHFSCSPKEHTLLSLTVRMCDGTGARTSFRGVLSYVYTGRFALGTVAARGIKPVDTPAALSH